MVKVCSDEEVRFPRGAGASHLAPRRSRMKPLRYANFGRGVKKAAQIAGIKEGGRSTPMGWGSRSRRM